MKIILMSLIILTVFSYKKNNSLKKFVLNRDITQGMKGFAILLVIIGHLIPLYDKKLYENFNFLQTLGTIGVTLFLFSSGYGLTKSYQKNYLVFFWKKKFKGVYIPYLLITILWIIIEISFGKKHGLLVNICALLGMDFTRQIDATMWYIPYIFFWYLSFFIVFSLVKKHYFKVIFLLFFSMLSLVIYKLDLLGSSSYQWGVHAFSFPIGVFYALHFERVVIHYRNTLLIFLFLFAAGGFALCVSRVSFSILFLMVANFFGLVLLTTLFLIIDQLNYKSSFIYKVGDYSYELYLLEGYLIKIMITETNIPFNYIAPIFFLTTFFGSIILRKFTYLSTNLFQKKIA